MEINYHIGDKVRIVDPIPDGRWCGVASPMRKFAGKVKTIAKITREGHAIGGFVYRLGDDVGNWNWESNMFEPAVVFELNAEEDAVGTALFGQFFDAFKVI